MAKIGKHPREGQTVVFLAGDVPRKGKIVGTLFGEVLIEVVHPSGKKNTYGIDEKNILIINKKKSVIFKKPVKVRSHKKKGTKGVRKYKRRKPLGRRKRLR